MVDKREAWLWENPDALAKVQRGLHEARNGILSDGPDLDRALAFADTIPDDDDVAIE